MKNKQFKDKNKGMSAGVNSEWVRHYVQNVFAHGWAKSQRMFEMLDDKWYRVYNFSNLGMSKFSVWSK